MAHRQGIGSLNRHGDRACSEWGIFLTFARLKLTFEQCALGEIHMGIQFARPLMRTTSLLSTSALAVMAPLVVAAAPASAAPASPAAECNSFTSGHVSFSICVGRVNSSTAQALVAGISGSYLSGSLGLYKNGRQVQNSCSGQYRPGSVCSYNFSGGGGSYRAVWHSKGSGDFSSPTIRV